MKRVFALLALVGAVAFGAPAWAEEKAATPAAVKVWLLTMIQVMQNW